MKKPLNQQLGFTLIESLIAILVVAIGLAGMAGLLLISVKTNQSAYLRTQAEFVARGTIDRIRSNRAQVLAYNGNHSAAAAGPDPCTGGVVCTAAVQATRDIAALRGQLFQFLPNSSANVNCNGVLLGTPVQAGAAPFNGMCTIRIQWDEAALNKNTTATPNVQTFSWVFQP